MLLRRLLRIACGRLWFDFGFWFVCDAAGGLLVVALASALRCLPFMRRPCAGRHLLLVVCDAGLFARVFAGVRVTVFAVHASPLCGAAPTFLCRRKEK